MSFHKDTYFGIAILILCLIGAYSVSGLPANDPNEAAGTASLPKASLIGLAACGVIQTIRGLKKGGGSADAKAQFCGKTILFFLFYIAYMAAMVLIGEKINYLNLFGLSYGYGFIITTVLFLCIALPWLGRKKPAEIISISVATTAILAVSFGVFFKILLP